MVPGVPARVMKMLLMLLLLLLSEDGLEGLTYGSECKWVDAGAW